jgi:hypothetical protein
MFYFFVGQYKYPFLGSIFRRRGKDDISFVGKPFKIPPVTSRKKLKIIVRLRNDKQQWDRIALASFA